MATRYYFTVKAPGAIIHGGCAGTWARQSTFGRSWNPVQWTFQASQSKTDGGTLTNHTLKCNQDDDYDLLFARWMTPPLEAMTLGGTFNLCQMLRARFLDSVTGAGPDTVAKIKIHGYVTVGQTATVRSTIFSNIVDVTDLNKVTQTWQSLNSAQAITSASVSAGDSIMVEFGIRIVSSPNPTVTYPPGDWSEINYQGTGTNAATGDATAGSTDNTLNPWFEFSDTLTEQAGPSAPANDACADAITISSLPYTSSFIDTRASADTDKAIWFDWTAPSSGQVVFLANGSNFGARVRAWRNGCTASLAPTDQSTWTNLTPHRSQAGCTFPAVSGQNYKIELDNVASTFNAANAGGYARLIAFYQTDAEEDDLYLPAGLLFVIRDGAIANASPDFISEQPTGIAIDYGSASLTDLGGQPHADHRVILGTHLTDSVYLIDADTLSLDEFLIDIIFDPFSGDTPPGVVMHCAQLYVTAASLLHIGWFGNGYRFVVGTGSLPAILNSTADDAVYSQLKSLAATAGDSQVGAPFTTTKRTLAIEHASPWAITLDESTGWLYYTSSGFYEPIGGASDVVRRHNLSTEVNELFATITLSGTNNPGLKGLQFIPTGGLLVCNGSVVHRLDASGNISQTYTPSISEDSQSLCDVKLTADGTAFWVIDEATTRLFQFNLTTGTEITTLQPYGSNGTLVQMAIYQPEGVAEPPGGNQIDCPHGSFVPNIQKSGSYLRTTNRVQGSFDTSIAATGSYTREFRPKQGTYEPTMGTRTGSF